MHFLLDDPYKFFRKNNPRFRLSVAYAIVISAVFSALNQASIYFGFTEAVLANGHMETAAIIFSSLIAGFFLVAGIFSLVSYRKLNRQTYRTSFFILAYAATPFMLFGWIPHAAVKVALLVWSFAFLSIGIHIQMKKKYKEAFLITIAVLAMIVIISFASQNFILAPV